MAISMPKNRSYKTSPYWYPKSIRTMKQRWFKEGETKPIHSIRCPVCDGETKINDARTGKLRDCKACVKHPGFSGIRRVVIATSKE